eukprot:UN05086
MQYVPTHSVGNCENNHPHIPRDDPRLSAYKFMITIENSLCRDYTTEKPYNTYKAGSIPIVASKNNIPDYSFLPEGSYT